jgi:uncharacterized membrane protein (DUF485 family)
MIQIMMDKLISYPTLAQIVKEYTGPPIVPEEPQTNGIVIAAGGAVAALILLLAISKFTRRRKSRR